MKIFTLLLPERKNTICGYAVAASILVVLLATAALGDEIDAGLPPDSSQAVKDGARQAIQSGLAREDVVRLTRAMLQNKFDEQQVERGLALMMEAKNSNLPVRPLMNKAFEGMTKNVDPSLIVGAMERVQSRNAFAHQRAEQLSGNKLQAANLGRSLSDALAAGFSKEDADKLTQLLQQRSQSMKSDKAHSLALACYETARDVSRLGVSSPDVTAMLINALNKGFNHQDMRAMRNAFVAAARWSDPQALARSYSKAIQKGRGFPESPGSVGGGSSGGGGQGASGSGSSGGSGGSGGSGSGGSGGSGSGGGGSGGKK